MNTRLLMTKDNVKIFNLTEMNARLRGALVEMLTAHGIASVFFGKRECTCHACTNARKLLAGE